jgi:hypothetical protein
MAVMRKMFKTAKTRKPKTNSRSFLITVVEAKKAKKTENIAKAIREYIPEQGISTAKLAVCPAAFDSRIVGAPYEDDSAIGNPKGFSMEYAT